jgi:hypothetical protein
MNSIFSKLNFTMLINGTILRSGISLRLVFVLCGALIITISLSAVNMAQPRQQGRRNAQTDSYRDQQLIDRAERLTGDEFQFATTTPRGVRIFTRAGGARPRAEMMRAIDDGLSELFAVARRNGYNSRTQHTDYTVFIARPDRTRNRDRQYSPDVALAVEGNYAGSIYDQGGFVYAAGLVVAFDPSAFAVAEHEQDFGRVRNIARYEGEHIILYHNDRRRYNATLDHTRAGAHPILQ